jgi:hypothetical protein
MYIVFEFLRRIGGTMVKRGCLKCGRSWAEALVRSDQIKDYTIGICCYSSQDTAIMSNNKDELSRNQYNMSEWSDMYTRCFSKLGL